VEIHERGTRFVNGWFGVLVLGGCIAAAILISPADRAFIAIPIAVGVIILSSLVIVQPGQTQVVQF
jgi:hypothetical protein